MELERIQNTGLALGAAPQTQSATSSSFGMCCIRPGNYTGTPAWQTSIPTKIPQTSKIAPETPRNYKREVTTRVTTREKLLQERS